MKREEVLSESELSGSLHPVPETAASHGCGWPAAHSFTVPESWRSGFYEVTLSVEDGGVSLGDSADGDRRPAPVV